MNKRIKELAEKAGSTHKQSLGVYQFYSRELEKYTEYIIEECIRQAISTKCPYTDEEQRKLLGHTWDMAVVESARNIRKHFNIEYSSDQTETNAI